MRINATIDFDNDVDFDDAVEQVSEAVETMTDGESIYVGV